MTLRRSGEVYTADFWVAPASEPSREIVAVTGIWMKFYELAEPEELSGPAARIFAQRHHVELSSPDGKELDIIRQNTWFEIGLTYSDGDQARLSFQKRSGSQVIANVLSTWHD